jgi:demethylmenaquinone methyltransferase/2-methoxy-6-polyprenyl-1,4-benzoquinol methylase
MHAVAYCGLTCKCWTQAAIREAYRVLKKGGRMLILEFSHVQNPLMGQVYDQFSFNVIPRMGQLVAGDAPSYQYLVESIRRFPKQVGGYCG